MTMQLLIEIAVGLFCGISGVAIKVFVPQLNPLQKGLVKVLENVPLNNKAIIELAEDLGEKGAKKFLEQRLLIEHKS